MSFAPILPALILPVLAIHVAAMMSPGPTFVVSTRIAAAEGLRVALGFALGVGCGSVVWALAALFGLALLFELAPALLGVLKALGGLFLIWIAVQTWRHAADPPDAPGEDPAPRRLLAAIRLGFLTQLANPKSAVYFGAVFAGLVPPGTAWQVLAVLLTGVLIAETLWFSIIARVFSLAPTRRVYGRMKRGIDRVFGGLIAAFGLKIATS